MTTRSASDEQDRAPGWETMLHQHAQLSTYRVDSFTTAPFAVVLAKDANEQSVASLRARVVTSLHGVDAELGGDWRHNEFRALLYAGCVWWRIIDPEPSHDHWSAYVGFAKLVDRRRETPEVDQRSFRHAWAGYQYRQRIEGDQADTQLLAKDFNSGRKNLRPQMQLALVAFLHAVVNAEEPTHYWDMDAKTFRRDGIVVATEPAIPNTSASVPSRSSTGRHDATPARVESQIRDDALKVLDRGNNLVVEASLQSFGTFAELGDRIRLLLELRTTLDLFIPAVFERSLDDLILAHDGGRDSIMTTAERRRLKRLAREYVRPGVQVRDMRGWLTRIQTQRREWTRVANAGSTPEVPVGLAEVDQAWRAVSQRLHELDNTLSSGDGDGGELARLPVVKLKYVLGALHTVK